MLKAHGCKKCNGAVLLDKDEYGWYEECILCGYTRDIPLDIPLDMPVQAEPITVKVVNPRKLAEMWKQDRIPSYQPLRKTRDIEEDAY